MGSAMFILFMKDPARRASRPVLCARGTALYRNLPELAVNLPDYPEMGKTDVRKTGFILVGRGRRDPPNWLAY
jgi:hypothetical protein